MGGRAATAGEALVFGGGQHLGQPGVGGRRGPQDAVDGPDPLTCLALLVAACVLGYGRGGTGFWLSAGAVVLVVAVIVLTVTRLDALNRLADSWDPDLLPADWARARAEWWNLHLVRTAMAVAGFLLLLLAPALHE
ncbi:anthrone oxygenase family protein [Herbidospora daliensis]|uniref:anthrone oxygenase family protein n=1 Tax=Herbidospora daliensis TaxID=295585 RepID=UPI001E508E2C|nr:anthrone oxygenase family protein [Herbidospora daliensis]